MVKAAYVVGCLVLPILWGVVSARIFDYFGQKRQGGRPADPETRGGRWDMYEI